MRNSLKKRISLALMFIQAIFATICLGLVAGATSTTTSTTTSYATPSEYFLSRMKEDKILPTFNKRNPNSVPYHSKASQRVQSSGGWSNRYENSNPSTNVFMYDGAFAYDTFNLDYHPYVMDIGCTRNGLFIRPTKEVQLFELLKKQFAVGNVLVSSKKSFDCHDHSLSDSAQTEEKILYRMITKSQYIFNKENGIEYFELETAKLNFLELFSNLKLLKTKPTGTVANGNARSTYISNTKAVQIGWNLKRDSKGNIININHIPTFAKDKVTGSMDISSITGLLKSTLDYECTNCYLSLYAGYSVYLEKSWWWPFLESAQINGYYDFRAIMPSLKVSATAKFEGEIEIMEKKDFYTVTFEIGYIPVELAVGFSLGFTFEGEATSSVTFASDYIRKGSAGFSYFDRRGSKTLFGGSTSGGISVTDVNALTATAKFQLEPTLHLTFYEFLPIIFQFNPYITFNIISNPTKACRFGFNTTWGVEGAIGVGEIELLGKKIWDGDTYDYDIVEESEIESMSGICIWKAKRYANQYLTIEATEAIPDVIQSGETISDSSEIVYRKWNFTSNLLDYYDGITFYLSFSVSCQVAFGKTTVELSKQKFHITFIDLLANNGTDITFAIHKNPTESVSISYVLKRTRVPFGESVKLRTGVVSLKPPAMIPNYLAINLGVGQLTSFLDGTVIQTLSPVPVSLSSYPFKTNYVGPDTVISIYPVYDAHSGTPISHVFDGVQTKIAVIYNSNAFSPNINSFVITPTFSTAESVSMRVSIDSSFSIQNLLSMPNAEQVGRDGISLSTIPEVMYIEVTSAVDGVELTVEFLEVYNLELSAETTFKYSALGPFGLSVTKSSNFGSLGMVIEMESDTQAYIGHNIPIEKEKQNALFASLGARKNVFGISKYYNDVLMTRPVYMRLESRLVIREEKKMTEGSIKFSELKNENITVSVKFVSHEGNYFDTLDIDSLMNGKSVYLAIQINDPQYTFNTYYISSTSNFVKFLSTLKTKEELSNWNQVILPNLAYYANDPVLLNVSLPDPQTMLIKIPPSSNFKSGKEIVSFSSISSHMFIPKPLQVSSLNDLSANSAILTPGDIGAIIASVVGFTIIMVLIAALGIVCYLWLSAKKKSEIKDVKDLEMAQNKETTN